jgi:hypothetical protein
MKVMVSVVNFIPSPSPVLFFLSEIHAGYGNVLYHTKVQRLSHRPSNETFFSSEARNRNASE